ncbi:4-hydroxy-tetrahydrodipicolinate synthase [Peptoniphilus sp. MSJ-1]|uniref:4-hydroxy-tetrahydrodipicolinate synthase n=1 Tax=Peptoniphilus ovalis TaxID=2841503 RepID=A0ABS6FIR8_9FIRM|nr:4-hydroxy-tetrahydrodipicolinate synthase [Peptoniphilus ovalis]MBU5670072.1 4-hydroxy-tetrahydrodipicolinate synthase [Peptoniphilus ovalis]
MTVFTGSGVAIVTPFFENGDINYENFGKIIDFQLENKTDALIVAGTTGEASTMTDEEQRDVIKYAVERVNGRVPVIAGAGSNNTDHGINLSKMCEEAGADALLQVTPYYNKTSQRGLIEHYKKIAENVNIPIILYAVPGRTAMPIAPETVLELSKIKNIVGLKDATGDLSYAAKVRSLVGFDFDIYSGNDDVTIPLMSIGAKGVISVIANIYPEEVHNMVTDYLNGETEKAARTQIELKELNDALFVEPNPIPVKAAMNIMGMDEGHLRLPLFEASDETKKRLEKIIGERK